MAVSIQFRADRAIMKRQQQEFHHEKAIAQGIEQFKVEQKGLWENRMNDVIRGSRVKSKAKGIADEQHAHLQARRQRLAQMLSDEQKAYEQEMIDREDTPSQRMDKMAVRAYELKKRREDERKAVVQEKLYQQWREGIDDLRTMDTKIVQLKTIAARDAQLDEKKVQRDEERAYDAFYAKLWHEGYLAKIEREEREKEMRKERNEQQTATLAVQQAMKEARIHEEKYGEKGEAEELKRLWAMQEEEEKKAIVQEKINAKVERKKADEYMATQQAQRAEEVHLEKVFDRNFVDGVLERERKLSEQEEAERQKAKRKAVEYTEALKVEMAQKAASEEQLIKLQAEESERQWAKRYESWEKEELARRKLMEEVYTDRAEQVRLKQDMRDKLKDDVRRERHLIDDEVQRLEGIEEERGAGEALVGRRHQEELFRQMDFHQVQRHRQLQQHAIEQRQAAIAEEKIRRAVKAETESANGIIAGIHAKRKGAQATVVAPWDR